MGEGDPPDCKAGVERHPEARREDVKVLERDGGEEMIELKARNVALATGMVLLLSIVVGIGNPNYGEYLLAAYIEFLVFMVLLFGFPKKKESEK